MAERALPLIPQHTEKGIAIGIQMEHFKEAMAAHPNLLERFGSPYASCLHWVLATLLKEQADNSRTERIEFCHEDNDFKNEARGVFTEVKQKWNTTGVEISFLFGRKDEHVPLQAADILAYEANKRVRNSETTNRRSMDALLRYPERLTVKCFDKQNMNWFVQTMINAVRSET